LDDREQPVHLASARKPSRGSAAPVRRHPSVWEAEERSDLNEEEEDDQMEWDEEEEEEEDEEGYGYEAEEKVNEDSSKASSSSGGGKEVQSMLVVPVSSVGFTHDSISPQFRDGRTFEALLEGLEQGKVNPLRDSFLTLNAFSVRNEYKCMNNRRLYCLKTYQEKVEHEVKVKLRVTCPKGKYLRFLNGYTTRNNGETVTVRWPTQHQSSRSIKNGGKKAQAKSSTRKPRGGRGKDGWSSAWRRDGSGNGERTSRRQTDARDGELASTREADDASDSDWGDWRRRSTSASTWKRNDYGDWGSWGKSGCEN